MRRLFFLFLLLIPVCLCAQRKEIAQAKQQIKAGTRVTAANTQKYNEAKKNLKAAQQSMQNLLKDSTNRDNDKIWLTLFDAVKTQYDNGNEQLYLHMTYDTAKLFTLTREMFSVLEQFDTIDAKPNNKGQIKPKYRGKHANLLNDYRSNLYNGGLFFARKQDFAQAFQFFDTYIDCQNQPLFSAYNYADNDTLLPRAAYMAMYCGFKQGNAELTLKYEELAKKDTAMLDNIYQYLSSAYQTNGDTVQYVATLKAGFSQYPSTLYFFSHLFDHYYKRRDMNTSLALCDSALVSDSLNHVFLFARSTVLLNLGRYEECIAISDKLIAEDKDYADAYLNAGLAYFNRAAKLSKNTIEARKQRSRMLAFYKQALPYIQRYRELKPDNKEKWGLPLYAIYLNLNMGKEFDEIDALLKSEDNGDK